MVLSVCFDGEGHGGLYFGRVGSVRLVGVDALLGASPSWYSAGREEREFNGGVARMSAKSWRAQKRV